MERIELHRTHFHIATIDLGVGAPELFTLVSDMWSPFRNYFPNARNTRDRLRRQKLSFLTGRGLGSEKSRQDNRASTP
jgi:hypothetical protein